MSSHLSMGQNQSSRGSLIVLFEGVEIAIEMEMNEMGGVIQERSCGNCM